MDTADHGLPHRRIRWYCVGILKSAYPNSKPFNFPEPISCPSLNDFINTVESSTCAPNLVVSQEEAEYLEYLYPDPTQRQRILDYVDRMERDNRNAARKRLATNSDKILKKAYAQAREFGLNPTQTTIAVDVDASLRHMTWDSGVLPCLTRSRYRGHWISTKNRRTTIKEMLAFQGIVPNSIRQTCSDNELGKMVGNSMSVNVIERILFTLLMQIGVLSGVDDTNVDRWKHLPLSILLGDIEGDFPTQAYQPEIVKWSSSGAGASHGPRFIQTKDTRCIVDTGASDHIISRKHLTPAERRTIRKSSFGLSFQTANRETFSDEIVDFRVNDLGITVTAWVLKDSPPLISLGKIIEDHDATYTWSKAEGPIIKIGNRTVHCSGKQRCPFVAVTVGCPGVEKSTPTEVPVTIVPKPPPVPKLKRRRKKLSIHKDISTAHKDEGGAIVPKEEDDLPPPPPPTDKKESPLRRELRKK